MRAHLRQRFVIGTCDPIASRSDEVMAQVDDLIRLRWAVQALARPADEQVTLFPDFTCKADELVLEFDEHVRPVLSSGDPRVSARQVQTLQALDKYIESVSGQGPNAANWTEEAIHTSAVWAKIRQLARATLVAFGWKDECPPQDRGDIFVGRSDTSSID